MQSAHVSERGPGATDGKIRGLRPKDDRIEQRLARRDGAVELDAVAILIEPEARVQAGRRDVVSA